MKQIIKYPLIFLFGLSLAGCGLMNTAIDDEERDSVDQDELEIDDRHNRGYGDEGGPIKGDQERPNGLG